MVDAVTNDSNVDDDTEDAIDLTPQITTTRTTTTTTSPVVSLPPSLAILHETERLVVLHKPPGISHHCSADEIGILELVRQAQARGELLICAERLYGVHRLDRVTSGILVLAKDGDMARCLTAAFRNGQVVKYYVGVSGKKRKPQQKTQGWVRGSLVKARRGAWKLSRQSDANFAETRFFTAGLGNAAPMAGTALLFRPTTGRTHQLRVTAKSMGLPLLGDLLYGGGGGGEKEEFVDGSTLELPRTHLHAMALHISHLDEEHNLTVVSPPCFWPQDGPLWQRLLEKHCDCDAIRAEAAKVFSATTNSS